MRLTTMTRYGTRAVFDLAYNYEGIPIHIKDISSRQEIPMRYLEQIFSKLKRSEFIKSERGPGGGYSLAKDSHEITVGDVIRAAKEDVNLVSCVCIEAEKDKPCQIEDQCVTKAVWKEAGRKVMSFLDSVTIASLCEDARHNVIRKDLNCTFE